MMCCGTSNGASGRSELARRERMSALLIRLRRGAANSVRRASYQVPIEKTARWERLARYGSIAAALILIGRGRGLTPGVPRPSTLPDDTRLPSHIALSIRRESRGRRLEPRPKILSRSNTTREATN